MKSLKGLLTRTRPSLLARAVPTAGLPSQRLGRPRESASAPLDFLDAESRAVIERFSRWVRQQDRLSFVGRPSPRQAAAGLDFVGYVEYAPGMDLRHLDWHVWARNRGRYVRRYTDERTGQLVILLDGSGSMGRGDPAKWQRARTLAAALSYAALAQLHRVAPVVLTAQGAQSLGWGQGTPFSHEIYAMLGAARPQGETQLAAAIAGLDLDAQSADAILITDGLDPRGPQPIFEALRRKGLRGDLIQLFGDGEFDLPAAGTSLADPEGLTHRPSPQGHARAVFERRLAAWRAEWAAAARAHNAAHVQLSTTQDLSHALGEVLMALTSARSQGGWSAGLR